LIIQSSTQGSSIGSEWQIMPTEEKKKSVFRDLSVLGSNIFRVSDLAVSREGCRENISLKRAV
jgi:hypothetical protein